jgi:hypothetical protein
MLRKKAFRDQYTASLRLLCTNGICRQVFFKEQKSLETEDRILCPKCGAVVAANKDEISDLRSKQVGDITAAFGRPQKT